MSNRNELEVLIAAIGSATGKVINIERRWYFEARLMNFQIVRRQTCEISLSYGYGCLTAPDNGNVNMVEEVGKVESAAIDVKIARSPKL